MSETRTRTITEIIAATSRDGRRQGWLEGAIAGAALVLLLMGLA